MASTLGKPAPPASAGASASRPTRRSVRAIAMTAYAVLFVQWCAVVGIPSDPVQLTVWIWFAAIAWNAEGTWRQHLAFLRDWSGPLAVILLYGVTRGVADGLGFPVHVRMPITVDTWLGGGTLPGVLLQRWLCEGSCSSGADDLVLTTFFNLVYLTHFVVALTLAGVLYLRSRPLWAAWLRRYLTMCVLGLVGYVVYPMAPPWMAREDGLLDPDYQRITGDGWSVLNLDMSNLLTDKNVNLVAAMPSLHAGISALVVFFAIDRLHSPARWLLLLYPLAMSVALVYLGEHYVIDLIAGVALAGLVSWGASRWEKRSAARSAPRSALAREQADERV